MMCLCLDGASSLTGPRDGAWQAVRAAAMRARRSVGTPCKSRAADTATMLPQWGCSRTCGIALLRRASPSMRWRARWRQREPMTAMVASADPWAPRPESWQKKQDIGGCMAWRRVHELLPQCFTQGVKAGIKAGLPDRIPHCRARRAQAQTTPPYAGEARTLGARPAAPRMSSEAAQPCVLHANRTPLLE